MHIALSGIVQVEITDDGETRSADKLAHALAKLADLVWIFDHSQVEDEETTIFTFLPRTRTP